MPQPTATPGNPGDDSAELARLTAALARLAGRAQAGGQRVPGRPGAARGGPGAPGAGVGPRPAAASTGAAAGSAAAQPAPRAAQEVGSRPAPRPASSSPAAATTAAARPAPAAPASPASAPEAPAARALPADQAPPASPEAIDPARMAPLASDLDALRRLVEGCTACGLCRTRTRTVFADGPPKARLMFVGEAPGAREDATGLPFVGEAGQLLTRIIEAGVGLPRAQVYIANGIKCRPPDNRDPSPEEKRSCLPFLERQIELVDPLVLVALGRHAANLLLGTDLPISALRGRVHERGQRFVVPTFHPADLLRNPEAKKDCWADVQRAMALLGLAPRPGRGAGPAAS